MNTLVSIIRADWGTPMHGAAKRIGSVCIAVYVAGFMLGSAVHSLNDILAGKRPLIAQPASAVAVAAADPAPVVASDPAPVADSDPVARFRQFTVKELRAMARWHGAPPKLSASGRRADLLAFMAALPG